MDFGSQRIVDTWADGTQPVSAQITANAGQTYPINIEYFENGGLARLSVQFIDTATGKTLSPADIFTVLDLSDPANQSVDSDNDGIPDVWEQQQGTSVYVADSAIVNNTAGISNLEAFQTNVSPWTTEALDGDINTPQLLSTTVEPSQSSVTLTWTAPLTRVDGSSLILGDIKGYELSYGQQANSLDNKVDIPGQETSYTIENLATGTWYFQLRIYDYNNLYSQPSEILEYIVM
jgi:hypothetical protein